MGNDHRAGAMDSLRLVNHFFSPHTLTQHLHFSCLVSYLFLCPSLNHTPLNFLIIVTNAISTHILYNYLNMLLLYFKIYEDITESVLCPEISHQTFSCESDKISKSKSFKFFQYNIGCIFLNTSLYKGMRHFLCLLSSGFKWQLYDQGQKTNTHNICLSNLFFFSWWLTLLGSKDSINLCPFCWRCSLHWVILFNPII
jgi:hypothetical protein